jgi:hypothetical protein
MSMVQTLMRVLRILLTKLSDDRHRLAIERDDASTESVELETRSFLLHDLVHYAVEAEAKIDDGFWGLLARGTTLAELSDRTMATPISPGIALAEKLVGPMQSVWNDRLAPELYMEHARGLVDDGFVDRVRERLRRLTGHWRSVPVRQVMELTWPPA